ncbi:unnamed protein product [Chironomus riparius]|uniref:F-box domain-containing protein n=1 Tax=Chironomus riparius TaxID=315576 RepID=A0A9P0J9U2_9DIPT|nr:unnamed protein product [Chironomus riparius]
MELPTEILVNILNYLDVPSLKQCLLVSRHFHNLIFNSSNLMRKLLIILNENSLLKKLEFIKNNGRCLRCLEITDHGHYLIKLLTHMPNISTLKISDNQFQYQVNQQAMRAIEGICEDIGHDFSALQELTIESNNPFVTEQLLSQFYSCSTLKSFNLICKMFDINQATKIVLLRKFLMNQLDLKELTLATMTKNDEIFENFDKMNFKLKKFTIGWDWENRRENFHENCQNFCRFLRHQEEILEELSFGHCGVADNLTERTKIKLFERMMIENLQNFNFLEVFDEENLKFERLQNFQHIQNYQKFNFKKLRKLKIWWFDKRIERLTSCSNIEFLDILYHNSLLNMHQWLKINDKFPNLKILKIQYYSDISDDFLRLTNQNYEQIFKILPNLVQLQVNTFGYSTIRYKKNQDRSINVKIYSLVTNPSTKIRLEDLRAVLGKTEAKYVNDKEFEKLLGI